MFVAIVALSMLMAPAIVNLAPIANAGELNGRMVFRRNDNFYSLTDRNGTFTAQVAWASAQNSIAWTFRPSVAVQSIASGPMDCTAGHLQLSEYHDRHIGVPVNYFWHSTVNGSFFNQEYVLYGSCTFPVEAGGRVGIAVLTFRFSYILESLE